MWPIKTGKKTTDSQHLYLDMQKLFSAQSNEEPAKARKVSVSKKEKPSDKMDDFLVSGTS